MKTQTKKHAPKAHVTTPKTVEHSAVQTIEPEAQEATSAQTTHAIAEVELPIM